jgi:hypothetical protein
MNGNAGTGLKPSDFYCIPLCRTHHNAIHNNGSKTFEDVYNVSLTELVLMVCQEWIKENG